ncbi:Alpha/Beta hydrolase protein [Mycena amicta]|nr:Alpha/Beta hydrolase protein [Mycena amicta]
MRLLSASLAALLVQVTTASLVVDLGYARYQGAVVSTATTGDVANFLGIRYAAAPVGLLRFRAPLPPPISLTIQNATVQPNECYQASSGGTSAVSPLGGLEKRDTIVQSEDCLFLKQVPVIFLFLTALLAPCSVYYPSNAVGTPPKGLPVIVWIHGGGYEAGGANQFNGQDIIRWSNRGVVIVIVQYRLGLFGFLAGQKVKDNGALNAGLLDQDAALRWVQIYISKFGGDPRKVTLWGQSAGAGSVIQQVIANNGNTVPQLFRAAISSSTYLPSQYQHNDAVPEYLFTQVVTQTSCTKALDAISCLRRADPTVLQAANLNITASGFTRVFLFVPVIDGRFVTQSPTAALAQGKINGQTLLSTSVTNEGLKFVNQTGTMNTTLYSLNLFPKFKMSDAQKVATFYAQQVGGTQLNQENTIQSDTIFLCPTVNLLQAFNSRKKRVFKGLFAIGSGLHASDLPYYWTTMAPNGPSFNNSGFIEAFSQTFTNFAISLDPNTKTSPTILPQWVPWTDSANGGTEMLFNKTSAGVPVVQATTLTASQSGLLTRCAFWAGMTSLTGQ